MNYPKQLMSNSELIKMGYKKDMLRRYAAMPGAPILKTPGGGKTYWDTDCLEDFIRENSKERYDNSRKGSDGGN